MAPTCDNKSCRILKLWINERQKSSGKRLHTKPIRKKRCQTLQRNLTKNFLSNFDLKTFTNLSTSKICLMLLILIKTINVTVATIDVDDSSKNQQQENLFKLVENKISLDSLKQSQYFKILNLISDLELKGSAHNLGKSNKLNNDNDNKGLKVDESYALHVQKQRGLDETKAFNNQGEDLRSQRSLGNVEILNRNFPSLELKSQNNETIFYDIHKRRRRRKKRYVKFPPVEGGRFLGRGHGRPFHPALSSVSGGYHGGIPPWVSGTRNPFHSHVPTMRPRSPRLVFRDPVEPGTLTAPASFFGNGLQDIGFEDDREERGAKGKYPSMGDQSLCTNGKCEFFLTCWMSSGLIDGSCGGFLYACCQRPDKEAPKTNEHHINDVITLPTNFGPVVNDFRCGVSIGKLGAQRRIVGGDEAGFGSFPWQAYIRIGSSRCGGSLVNRFHVVTAGHCVARASARQVQVTLGDYVINSAVEPLPAYTFGVREIRVHPYFKFTPQADRFDVAVLRLDRPVQYMPHIAPICLPEKNEDFLGQYGWAAGWGALQAGSRLRPKTLQAVDVPVIDNRLCERWHKSNGINVVIYDEMMCAGYRNGGKDSCQGDSGGPLMMEKSNRWYLIGIVSAGYSCAQRGQPGIYHRVAHTVDWISYIINS